MARVAYVLKAFGRTSETFISNEIRLLEQFGIPLRIFSLKTLKDQRLHRSVRAIESPVQYMPEMAELNEMSFAKWLWRHLPVVRQAHARVASRRPLAYVATLFEALWMCVAYRERMLAGPRKVFLKEFLQAGYLADILLDDPETTHLHAHFCHGVTTVTMFASRLCGKPFSFTAHAKDIYVPELNPGQLLQRKLRRAEFAVTCTGANKNHLDVKHVRGDAHVQTIYHGLDTSLFAPQPARTGKPRILSVGRFVEKKGFTYLVDACAILRDRGYDFECLIVGGADAYKSRVEQAIADQNLGGVVKLLTSVTQEELRDIYATSTAFALPCQMLDNGDRDGIPNVLAEAMAMQLPVVSTDISGIPEIVRSGENGLLVPPKNADALAGALGAILESETLRERLGHNARKTILDVFDSRKNTEQLASLFEARLFPSRAKAEAREALSC